MGDLVGADKVIGKTLIAQKNINVYINKPVKDGGKVVGVIKSGNPCGVVYSYAQDADGTVLWQFKGRNGISPQDYYFVQHREGNFALSDLKQQGVITTYEAVLKAEEEKKKENETIVDKIGNSVEKIFLYGFLIWGGVKLFESMNKK